jgi:predicted dehydrogenase
MQTWRLDGPGAGVEHDLTVHTIDVWRFVLDDEVERVVAMEARQGLGLGRRG